ncbi:hypothetical protein KC19_4G034600 [Ceratodon purpureus]|uniref:Ubiquitin carboxyl-terminal hydrolase n=1 Tax=Ceratodon purpureus TaxID=3225 RepID=A0A8T0I512_CERPU|nr:hypothetical protein KC19_4G034600 [Ceratodon purpureus]
MSPASKCWLPLEANPDVMNKFLHGLGFPANGGCHDVVGFNDELLAMVPSPVLAVFLLFPIPKQVSENIYFINQSQNVRNAGATIALLHAVGNTVSQLHLEEGSFLQRFMKTTSVMTPHERGHFLETDIELREAHTMAAYGGDTQLGTVCDLHYITFMCVDDGLYELDGRKTGPVYHGPSSQETLLKDSVRVVEQTFIAHDPDSMRFNVIVLVK